MLEKIKTKIVEIFIKKEDKLNALLGIIDSITVNEESNMVKIVTSKNLVIENNGHSVLINSGMQVMIGKQIHLNPNIDFSDRNIETLEQKLKESVVQEELITKEEHATCH